VTATSLAADKLVLSESLRRSLEYGQRVLDGFQKLISHITPLLYVTANLLHRRDKSKAKEAFEDVFKKYDHYYLKSFTGLLHDLPNLQAQANMSIQLFSRHDLNESCDLLQFAIDPCERRVRERRESAVVRNDGENDDDNRTLHSAIMNLHTVCESVVLNAHAYSSKLINVFFNAAEEDCRE
jgi:hypothetical protein